MALFLIGVGSAVAIWWGLWILKSGSKRSWARRKEQKRLEKLSEQLDDVDAQPPHGRRHAGGAGPPHALTRRRSRGPRAGLRRQVVPLAEPVRTRRR